MPEQRHPLEVWFDRFAAHARWHLGRTMIPCPLDLRLDEAFATAYGPSGGEQELRHLIATWEGLPEDAILPTIGGTGANAVAMLALAGPDRTFMIPEPAYYQWPGLARRLASPRQAWSPWSPEASGGGGGPRAWFAVSPDNPTGRRVPLDTVARGLHPEDVIVVDEIYRGVRSDGLEPVARRGQQWVGIGAVSKRLGLPGLRVGWLAATDPVLLESLHDAQEHLAHSLPGGAVRWLVTHWNRLMAWETRSRALAEELVGTLAIRIPRFAAHGLAIDLPEAGLSTLIRGKGLTQDVAIAESLADHGIFVVPGTYVGHPGTLRLSLGLAHPDEAGEALDKLVEALVPDLPRVS
ncbi:MAG: pyridoxal phosphate-dependent aminotransferase [Candidatus Sericytochromatia bacterium]|nr:pyridoxal phosphate-dependent aminotransferase [Candidatus Sericytochromatia bacterium]